MNRGARRAAARHTFVPAINGAADVARRDAHRVSASANDDFA
jgi:hypothetical protein